MKKIGILFGMENTFPQAFIDRVNSKGEKDIIAEAVYIDKVVQADPTEYAVIIDRISQDVPFYRAYLKNAALSGTAVINNPFWWSADEKFFNNALAEKIGVPVPKTVLLPSKERPADTSETSFRNLAFPLAWEEMFQYIGFPAYMKPHDGGGWKSVYKVNNIQDMWNKHQETGNLIMMLQEEIEFDDYVRCYCIGQKDVLIMPYEPRNPHHLRYASELKATGEAREKLLATIKGYVLKLNIALGYDFNTVEFAVRDGIPIAIDFCNPAPDADIYSVGHENFEWVVEAAANMAIERAKAQVPGQTNLTWGTFVKESAAMFSAQPPAVKEVKVKTVVAKAKAPEVTEPPIVLEAAREEEARKINVKKENPPKKAPAAKSKTEAKEGTSKPSKKKA
jgi:glutathione synthase/RimK-type ligase-like ATP-grasp enzyme